MVESKIIFEKPRKIKFNHSNKIGPQLRMIVFGKSNSGKTFLLMKLLLTENILDYNNLHIFTTTPEQSAYQILLHGFKNNLSKSIMYSLFINYLEDEFECNFSEVCQELSEDEQNVRSTNDSAKSKEKIEIIVTNKVNELLDPSDLNKSKKNIVIFDDIIDSKKFSILPSSFFVRSRHFNCGVIFLSQSFFGIDHKLIRSNANIFVIFKTVPRTLRQLLQNINIENIDEFKRDAFRAWKKK